jgi:hydroxymethylpyrimidine/phosphomethylpyrimidine kinase
MIAALTIAGFDPSGGAGLQQDLKVFRALGVYGLSVVSSVTAQSSIGVADMMQVPGKFVSRQLDVLMRDMKPCAVKTGMLYSAENVNAVARAIRRYSLVNVVVDPVILSSTGKRLCMKNVPAAVRRKLLPLCAVVTPNIHEASVLSGIEIRTEKDRERAAVKLKEFGAGSVIITGGHLEESADDLLYDGGVHYLKGRKATGEYHGTGCTFSAALAASLAQGKDLHGAAILAKAFMKRAFRKTFETGKGMKLFNI